MWIYFWCWNPGFWKTELVRTHKHLHGIKCWVYDELLFGLWLENLNILKIIEKRSFWCAIRTWKLRVFTSVFDSVIQIRFILSRWVISPSSYRVPMNQWKSDPMNPHNKMHIECTIFIIKTAQGIRPRCFGFSAGMLLFWLKNLFITK